MFGRSIIKIERTYDYDKQTWTKKNNINLITQFEEPNVKLPKFTELVPDIMIKKNNEFGNILSYINHEFDD
jgi:hypothetical protein